MQEDLKDTQLNVLNAQFKQRNADQVVGGPSTRPASDVEKVQLKLMQMHRRKSVVSPKGNPVLVHAVAPTNYDSLHSSKKV